MIDCFKKLHIAAVLGSCLAVSVTASELALDNAHDFAIGKFNGTHGVAVSFNGSNKVVIFNGTPATEYKVWKTVEIPAPWRMRAADIDGDKQDDLVVISSRRTLTLLLSSRNYQALPLKNNNHRNLSALSAQRNADGSWLFGNDASLWLYKDNKLSTGYLYMPGKEMVNNIMIMRRIAGGKEFELAALSKLSRGDSKVSLRTYKGPFPSATVKPQNGKFNTQTIPFAAFRIAACDLNGDGNDELIISDNSSRSIIKSSSGDIELADGGDIAAGEGMFVFYNNRGARVYKGSKPVLIRKFNGRFRSCMIKDGFFYGLTENALEIHPLDASVEDRSAKAEADFKELLKKNAASLAAADALANRQKTVAALKARDELLFQNNEAVIAAAQKLLTAPAGSRSGRIAALRAMADIYSGCKFTSNRYAGHGVMMYPPQFFSRYCFNLPEDQVKELEKKHQQALYELLKLKPQDMELRFEIGYTMLMLQKPQEARKQFDVMLATANLSLRHKVLALFGIANCDFMQGKKDAMFKRLEELAAIEVPARMFRYSPPRFARELLTLLRWEFDALRLPQYTGGKPYPEPQQAEYTDRWASAPVVALKLTNIKKDDNRIKFLIHKLGRFGIKVAAKAPYTIELTQNSPDAPAKNAGYKLVIDDKKASIAGKDKAGVFWGIISLLQMTDQQQKSFRIAQVTDYPDTAERGFLFLGDYCTAIELAMFAKMNRIVAQGSPLDNFMELPLTWYFTEEYNKFADSLGMTVYTALRSYFMTPENISTTTEGIFQYHSGILKKIAASRGGVDLHYDDHRFPANWRDMEKYPIIGELDGQYVNRLYHEVKKSYPDARIIFGPPFYWGPDGPANNYGEKREDYLAAIGRNLDKNVDVYWTGPRVRGREKSPEKVKWFADLIQRKPFIFQNAAIYGAAGLHYYCGNPTPYWKTWHYDKFINDIAGFNHNTRISCNGPQPQTAGDCLWNWKAYNAEKSIRRAVDQLYGKGVYEVIMPGTEALNKVDRFRWQGWNINDAVNSKKTIEESIRIAEDAWKKATKMNPRNFAIVPTHYPEGLEGIKDFLKKMNDPNSTMFTKFVKELPAVQAQAVKEVSFDTAKGDLLRSPADFGGSGGLMVYGFRSEARLCTILRGRQTPNQHLTFNFECDPFPPEGNYELWISGQNHNRPDKFRLRVIINNQKAWEGNVSFPTSGWSVMKVNLPFALLKRNNAITLLSCVPGDATDGPPWVLINYVVIRKSTSK